MELLGKFERIVSLVKRAVESWAWILGICTILVTTVGYLLQFVQGHWPVIISALTILILIFFRVSSKKGKSVNNNLDDLGSYDWRVDDVILGLFATMPDHSFQKEITIGAARQAFREVHKCMCDGSLPVVGSIREFSKSERIPTEECKELVPDIAVISKGLRYFLRTEDLDIEDQKPPSKMYHTLYVRGEDVRQIWPRLWPKYFRQAVLIEEEDRG